MGAIACDCYALAMRSHAVAGAGENKDPAAKAGGFPHCKGAIACVIAIAL